MEESSVYQNNPWSDDDRSLGAIRKVLFLAERTGHLKKPDVEATNSAGQEGIGPKQPESLKMISLSNDISHKRRQIEEASLDIQRHLLDKETKDLTHTKIVEKRVEQVNELTTHIQKIVGHKDQLVSCLQQPYVGDFIKVDASYKKYISEVFPLIVPTLSELSSQLDNIDWVSKVDISDGELESVLSDITTTLAGLQSSFQSLTVISQKFHLLHEQKVGQSPH